MSAILGLIGILFLVYPAWYAEKNIRLTSKLRQVQKEQLGDPAAITAATLALEDQQSKWNRLQTFCVVAGFGFSIASYVLAILTGNG